MSAETLNIKIIENHYRFLKNLDSDSKKKLIIKLTESIDNVNKIDKIDKLFGAWKDLRSEEEILDDLKNSRSNIREVENL